MPSKASHLIAFLGIALLSAIGHRWVYTHAKTLLYKDFPRHAKVVTRIACVLFVYFDLPFLFLFFSRHITWDASVITRFLIYPFSVWQFLMAIWIVILVPMNLWHRVTKKWKRV